MANAYPGPLNSGFISTDPRISGSPAVERGLKPGQGAVTLEVDGLDEDVSKLEAIVSDLEDRLELGLTPSEPRPPSIGMDELPPDACSLAHRIHNIRMAVHRLQERGSEITNRVQL